MSNTTSEIIAEVENQLTLNRGLLAGFVFMTYDYGMRVEYLRKFMELISFIMLNLGLEVDMIWTRRLSAMTFVYILYMCWCS